MKQYFLKCDISGIQSFIFNVPSKGAAKALKSRSIFVQTAVDECLTELAVFFKNDNVKKLYNGGGNFYLEISTTKTKEEIDGKMQAISNKYLKRDIFPHIAYIEKDTKDIFSLLNRVSQKIQKAKMQRPISVELFDAKPEEIKNIDIFNEKGVNGQIPKSADNNVLEFDEIAEFSTGDKKLAALKLDVDNLGALFMGRTEQEYKTMSDELIKFFDNKLLQLIKDLKMQQNIYVVFSGGDDCFLIGTWEKVLEFSIVLRQEFAEFQKTLKTAIASLPKDDITFSAGIVVFQPGYSMLQLAEEAEEALNASKRAEKKNSITIFGKTLTWKEFEKTQALSKTLEMLINSPDERNNENKNLLQIFRSVYSQAKEMPKVWRLKYYLQRNVKNKDTIKPIFDDYSQALLFSYVGDKTKNPDVYLVASRWTELLLK